MVEELSKRYSITVACLEDAHDHDRIKQASLDLPFALKTIFLLGEKYRGTFFSTINFYLKKGQLLLLLQKSNVIWLNTPTQFLHIKPLMSPRHTLVYDCMDDIAAFQESNPVKMKQIQSIEKALCEKADLVMVSSEELKRRIKERYAIEKNVFLVQNGLSDQLFSQQQTIVLPLALHFMNQKAEKKFIVYIGTISSWFDFESLIFAANNNAACKFVLVGPADVSIPNHPSIIHIPPVQHKFIYSIMQASDVLIMPFKITELVKAVNPVKAYEYISSGKPVILSSYTETQIFEDYACLYTDSKSFSALISAAAEGLLHPKQSLEDCLSFARQNTWSKRGDYIEKLLGNYFAA